MRIKLMDQHQEQPLELPERRVFGGAQGVSEEYDLEQRYRVLSEFHRYQLSVRKDMSESRVKLKSGRTSLTESGLGASSDGSA